MISWFCNYVILFPAGMSELMSYHICREGNVVNRVSLIAEKATICKLVLHYQMSKRQTYMLRLANLKFKLQTTINF